MNAQTNLVPNSSFENIITCPSGIGQLFNTTDWINPTGCTPDFFHQCGTMGSGVPSNSFGNELAKTGLAYAGFYTFNKAQGDNGREYIQVKLNDTLEWGKKYFVSNSSANYHITETWSSTK